MLPVADLCGDSRSGVFPPHSRDPAACRNSIQETDHDQDQNTPRVAQWITDVKDGTLFQLTLLTAGVDEVPNSTQLIRDDLKSCGIEVEIELLPASELLAPGPEGPVFGRQFDLAIFAWAAGSYQLCQLFMTDEIPGLYPVYPKGWGGVNAPGFSSDDFDAACGLVLTNLPDSLVAQDAVERLISTFEDGLPVVPLFFRRQVILTRPELTGFENGTYDLLWNIESVH